MARGSSVAHSNLLGSFLGRGGGGSGHDEQSPKWGCIPPVETKRPDYLYRSDGGGASQVAASFLCKCTAVGKADIA